MSRVEIWFSSGLFRAFPNVKEETFREKDGWIKFTFGKGETHQAAIQVAQINFMEEMEEQEES